MSLLRLALGALIVFATTASASAQADPNSLQSIQAQVEQLRGLSALAQPPVQVLGRDALHQYLVDELERDYLPSERESDQKELTALGLIQPSDDLLQIQLSLLSEQVIGLYDPSTRSMFVLGDTGGPVARITYAHEFTHALQDQHYDLRKIAPKHPESNDRSLAVHALIEGDAVMLQTRWALANLGPRELDQLAHSGVSGDDVLMHVPAIVRAELLFPYVDGLTFVRQAYRRAGNSFSGVDDAFRNPPTSTAQILHPDEYMDGIQPVDVSLPDLSATLGSDWRRVGSSVLGELDTRVLLEQYGDNLEARQVAAGWNGDRWQYVETGGQWAIVLASSWESDRAAAQFFDAYGRGLQTRFSDAVVDVASDREMALTSATAAADLRLSGHSTLAVIASDRATANAVLSALGSASAQD